MWDYSDKVKEHFYNPKNSGAANGFNAMGDVGSISCGDALRLTLRVNPGTEVIEAAGFQTFGCGSAIASSSALTEIVKGMTLDEALKVSNQDIADFLDGLPPEKMHCSVMGREALRAAVCNYRGEIWSDDHEEGALVCKCFAVDEFMIREQIDENHLSSVEEVTGYTKAGGSCCACHEAIERILFEALEARGERFEPGGVAVRTEGQVTATPIPSGKTLVQRIRGIEAVLDAVRPELVRDGGNVELVDLDGQSLYLKLTGACSGCQLASATLGGIQQRLLEQTGEFFKLVPVERRALS